MSDLIKALQIFQTYLPTPEPRNPTHCAHDVLYIMGVGEVSEEHAGELEKLGFFWDVSEECWFSFRFGSA